MTWICYAQATYWDAVVILAIYASWLDLQGR